MSTPDPAAVPVTPFAQLDRRPDVSDYLVRYLVGVEQRPDVIAMHALATSMAAPPPGGTALDVGCGVGGGALELAKDVGPLGTVIGVDLAEAVLEVARRRATGPVRFEVGDATDLQFPDDEFDLVRCERVLQHVPDADAAVAELVRVCRPGGQVLLLDTDWRSLSVDLENDALVDAVLGIIPGHGEHPRSGFELRRRLVRAGCEDVRVSPYVFVMTSREDAGGLLPMFDTGVPHGTPVLPDRCRDAWFAALQRADEAGELLVTVTAWAAAGRKPAGAGLPRR